MTGIEILFFIFVSQNFLGDPHQILTDLDTSMNVTTNQSDQSLRQLLNETLQNLKEINQTITDDGGDIRTLGEASEVHDPSDLIGGIAGAENFDEPQIINQTQ